MGGGGGGVGGQNEQHDKGNMDSDIPEHPDSTEGNTLDILIESGELGSGTMIDDLNYTLCTELPEIGDQTHQKGGADMDVDNKSDLSSSESDLGDETRASEMDIDAVTSGKIEKPQAEVKKSGRK